ncbi:MAG: DNA-protecting protein DprA [Actinomycetota bacterium]|nr:DNA-protecting protein DprA [Actinomycetota bacterium]
MSASNPARNPLPPGAYAVALANLPGMGPVRLHRLVAELGPGEAWESILAGRELRPDRLGASAPRRSWAAAAQSFDVASAWEGCQRRRIQVTWPGDGRWPPRLADDPHPPGVLFWRGDLKAARQPAVAVIGTRRASPEGRSVAFELGLDLARAGVTVVSGLALGIDGAAHAGALEAWDARRSGGSRAPGATPAATVGVAASGVDVVYPRRHADLWRRVGDSGTVVSETPPGGAPASWRFPARNRIIVALVRMVVVVESHIAGGSMVTVEAALARGTEVRAVPGPVRASTSAGPNQLLCDGAAPVRHAGDVLDGLGVFDLWPRPPQRPLPTQVSGAGHLDADAELVCQAVGWHPTTCGQVVERCGLPLGPVARHLDELEAQGRVVRVGDQWSQAFGSR